MKAALIIFFLVVMSSTKLYQVLSVFRHGARYHLSQYYDGYSTYDMWGQITPVGMRQHENLGKIIANQYIKNLNFLSSKYNPAEVEIYATDANRTIMSGLSHIYGVYQPGNGPRLGYVQRKYHLPPFTNQTDIEQQNFAFPLGHQHIVMKFNQTLILYDCPNLVSLWQKNYQKYSAVLQQHNLTYTPFVKRLISQKQFGLPENATFQNVNDLYDVLVVNKYLGKPLPNNFTQADFTNIEHLYNWLNNMKYSGIAANVYNTRKYEKIINTFDSRISNLTGYPLKWVFLSAHDDDILSLQTDMNISSFECIEEVYRKGKTDALNCQNVVAFASSIIFELHSDDNKNFYVMVRSQGKYINLCEKQSTKCPYTEFKARIKRSMVPSVQQTCGIKSKTAHQKQNILIEQKERNHQVKKELIYQDQ